MIKMKNIKLFAGICMFVSALAFLSACSDDDNGDVAPVFPDKVEELSLTTAGETAEFSFTANTDWTLTSSKLWCKFVSEGENMVMLYGPAGEQNVKVIVTDDIWDFEAATAEISLNMGDESKVIAKITRGAKGLVINGYDDEHPLNISYGYSQDGIKATMTMDANFDWELTENGVPEWLTVEDLPLKGFAGRSSEITFVVRNDAKVSAQTGVISFNQIGTGELRSFPVSYAGMGDRDIEISLGGNVWNWIVSQDGKLYWQGSITEGVEVEKNDLPMDVEIATKDNKYHIVKLVHGDESLEEPFRNEYFWVENNGKGNISILEFLPNSADEREGFILAIPNFVYENELDNDINNLLDEYDKYSIKYEYGQYVVWNFKQEGKQEESGDVLSVIADGENITIIPFADFSEEELITQFGTKDVFMCTLPFGKAYENFEIKQNKDPWSFMVQPIKASEPEINTAWEGVNWETVSSDGMSAIIKGISSNSGSDYSMMILTFYDNMTEKPYAVLILMRE